MTSLGSLNDYEEYPAKCCWVHPRFRMCEDPPSDSEESPQLSLFEIELERRETERKTQKMRPFCQKRVYWCFSLRIWQMILIYSVLLALTICIVGLNVHFTVKLKDKAESLKHVGTELDKKSIELQEIKRKIEDLGIQVEQKQKEIKEKEVEFQSLACEKQKSDMSNDYWVDSYSSLIYLAHEESKQEMKSYVRNRLERLNAGDTTIAADPGFVRTCNVILFSLAYDKDVERFAELYTLMLWTGSSDFITLKQISVLFNVFDEIDVHMIVLKHLEKVLEAHDVRVLADMNEQPQRAVFLLAIQFWHEKNIEASTKLLQKLKNERWVDLPYFESYMDKLAGESNEEEKDVLKQFNEFVKKDIFTRV